MDYISIGPTPPDEDCVQLGADNYEKLAKEECKRYIKLLREKMGEEPFGASLHTKAFSHDFGIYYEVVCSYDENIPEAVDYAFSCESDGPLTWEG